MINEVQNGMQKEEREEEAIDLVPPEIPLEEQVRPLTKAEIKAMNRRGLEVRDKYEDPQLRIECAQRKKKNVKRPSKRVGRPPGGNVMNELVSKMKKADADEVFSKLLEVAKDPEHKNYGHATKILMDRVAHISHYEKDKVSKGTNEININISGMDVGIKDVVDDQ